MALIKGIKQDNGIILNYHRITDIKNVVNDKTYINISSYVDEEEREKEKEASKEKARFMNLYIINDIIIIDYNDKLTVKEAYEYLKTTEKYKDAIDG